MPMPAGIDTVTVTGRYVHPDGSPLSGSVTFAAPALLQLSGADTIAVGASKFTLDSQGMFEAVLVATDNADMQPTEWKYQVTEQLNGINARTYWIDLPSTPSPVDLADIAPADPARGTYVLVPGTPGPAGNTILSGHGTPSSSTGRDGDFYMDLDAWELYGPKASGAWPAEGLPITDVIQSVNGQTGTVVLDAADVGAEPAGAVSTHASATTSVHGIANTAALETQTGAQTKATAAQSAAISAAASDATTKANNAQSAATTAAATDATSKVSAHAGAADPHGDRAYTDGKAAGTVTASTTFGQSSAAGSAATFSRGDHTHGTPTLPAASTSVAGVVQLDGTAGDIQALGTQAAGTTGKAADAGHVHPTTGVMPLAGGTMTGPTNATLIAATTVAEASLVTGDTFDRYRRYADGKQEWGPGNAARDSVMYRDGVDSLRTDDSFTVAGTLRTPGGMTWRRRHLPDPLLADGLYTGTAPTISVAQTGTPTSGYIKYAPAGVALTGSDVTGPFTYLGAGNITVGTGTPDSTYVLPTSRYPWTRSNLASSQSVWSVEFATDTQIFQLRFNYQVAGMYRLSIDGRKVTDLTQAVGGTTAGSTHLMTIDLGSAAIRTIRLDFYTVPFGGIYLPPTATMWSTVPSDGRMIVFGDSISDGSSNNAGSGAGTWTQRAARLLGCNDIWDQARGGTGYITPGSFATLADRVNTDVIAWTPSRLVIWAGYNDNTGSQSAIATAAASLYSAIKAGLPQCETYVIGCWCPTASPATSITNTDNTLKTAAATAGFPFISPLTGSIYDATGTLVATHGAWITSANIAAYISGDAVHPTDAGHVYLSRRIVAAIRQLMPA